MAKFCTLKLNETKLATTKYKLYSNAVYWSRYTKPKAILTSPIHKIYFNFEIQ